MLVGLGLHGVAHLAQSAAYGGHAPGAAASPTVVIPYSLWALHRSCERRASRWAEAGP
ncbi:HXXEE domain-containing protein [Streptomyces sp. A0642]|uniref:HXXEE domain-containing protein n=1 Tax=Streptomyces sp. A0642 TaxID=2563100 RepID=UPI003211D535